MDIKVERVDYLNQEQGKEIGFLLNAYAGDLMGGGKPLADGVIENIATELSKIPHAFSVIAYMDGQPAGLVNCFEGFSTFSCKPLINIHDMIVLKEFRGHRLGKRMLEKVEENKKEWEEKTGLYLLTSDMNGMSVVIMENDEE